MVYKLTTVLVGVLALLAARQALAVTDNDIMNFAMNLECLEAEYYSNAVYGYGLNQTTLGGGPGSTGGLKANLSPDMLRIATELANDEINHVSTSSSSFILVLPAPRPIMCNSIKRDSIKDE